LSISSYVNAIAADVLIVGAGAAGLMCAIEAGKRGRRVIVIDHARKPGEKIRISGGGRCNFTNIHASPEHFLSQNPRFCVSALSRYTAQDFISLVEKHGIAYHEKTLGQLFCDHSSQQIVNMLLEECRRAGASIRLQTKVEEVRKAATGFHVRTSEGEFACESLVVASGGLSIPKMGATGLGLQIARQFGLSVVPTRAALVPFTLSEAQLATWKGLSGVAVQSEVQCGKQKFREGMLFTHRGLSGPAMLQISSYWEPKEVLRVNMAPECDVAGILKRSKATNPRQEAGTVLGATLPKRLAQRIVEQHLPGRENARLGDMPDRQLEQLGCAVNHWRIVPQGTEGYRTAEVMAGGVDTAELSSKTMESRKIANLYFIGEVVDVTGHLGGYNFQWAWSSGYVAGQYV
jgi:predicted Rossmann fold flavoprotein